MDVERASKLYGEGQSLQQVATQLGVSMSTVWRHLKLAGVPIRPGGRSPLPISDEEILELRDAGLSMPEVAERVGLTVPGAWSRYRKARPPAPPRLGRWEQVLADALAASPVVGVQAQVARHLGRSPTRSEVSAARRAAHNLSRKGLASASLVAVQPSSEAVGASYLVMTRRNSSPPSPELLSRRHLAAVSDELVGAPAPNNQARATRNLAQSLRKATTGARLIEAGSLRSDTAAKLAADLDPAIAELKRLQSQLRRRHQLGREPQ